ncbi:proline-rich protein 7 [Periophthalmus magnuspinnatus]|uniref:proline-rich protein 7 n=1 Tax=Periophthalmus magnuspinnatus TaxID=409849 RepID=UPI00243705F2|nr:proline-rich protein 7 [Periophthalmus magnuspinnatus]
MVMSQGTYTFLACFAGFWLIWAAVVLFCCFCSFLQRRLKRHREERLREAESVSCHAPTHPSTHTTPAPPPTAHPRETAQLCSSQVCPLQAVSGTTPLQIPHPLPQANWVTMPPDTEVFGKPPCYEEAVLMEDPPPPYSEVLADPRGGTYLKPGVLRPAACYGQAPCHAPCSPPPVFSERGYSSLIRLPSSQRWDSLGHLLSNMDLNYNHLTPPSVRSMHTSVGAMATMPRRDPRTPHELRLQAGYSSLQGRTNQRDHRGLHRVRGLEQNCGLPTALPLLGRSTAV